MDQKKKKIRVAVLFGGKSAEHEVSIQSAKNVVNSLDKNTYEVVLIGIDKKGNWHLYETFDKKNKLFIDDEMSLIKKNNIDVVFPVLHGPYGEDGSMQGFLKVIDVPFVGAGVLGSAVGMDKDVMKRLLRDAGLPIGKFLTFRKGEAITFDKIEKEIGLPFFVKPANLGSSIGVSKVKNETEFKTAITEAFLYDTKILVEEQIDGKEIECSVLGNDIPLASVPGEIIARHDFYSYEAKYLDEHGAQLKIPAAVSQETVKEIQDLAIQTFKTLCLDGMARIDFFLTTKNQLFVNEANTIPGFTNISMYPKLWEASGISYAALVNKLIQLALDKYQSQQNLKTSL